MLKSAFLTGASLLLLATPATAPQYDRLAKHKAVAAYEVRPGILAIPQYADDGRICEIGLEREHYLPTTISLDSSMDRELINQISDELAPLDERGAKSSGERDITAFAGLSLVTFSEYEYISIQTYSYASRKQGQGIVAAVIKWKGRKCESSR